MLLPDTFLPGGAPLQDAGTGGGLSNFFQSLFGNSIAGNAIAAVTGGGAPAGAVAPPMSSGYGSMMLGPDGRLYRRAGRPLLWSGDVSAMKRLRKVNKMMHHLFPVHHSRRRVRR
jgi:hypothetical protein